MRRSPSLGAFHAFGGADLDLASTLPAQVRRTHLERLATSVDARCGALDAVCVEQVHGVDVFRASAGNGGLTEVRADALVTDRPGVVLVVRTADCAPVLVAGSRAVAAIHAGWRGLAAGVVAAALDALRALDPGPFTAAVGPCIGPAAFEVGDEVVGRLGPFAVVSGRSTRGRPMVDLAAGCVAALAAGGVHAVDAVGVCTVRDAGWWSHRRDGPQAGRQGAAIAVAR